ncbi:hypothetical protein ACH95_04240 [Bacillus glycinifermentans]|uniref:Amidase n=1 Tax=Bacillus glycinifermentans TaxID=1664069 RepID=A0A0J6F1H0_9BACI|nr:hypothetical protein [Bacillus glycinifermentans]ATH91796.1 hypothetical protein COP00_03525 [Bacillus glycinifermentans]KMM62854.1 hypothetical protein ACH95_04240 [Bacillus glycinifermentans]KRT95479.1 hypothetical protein AB447_209830 [Bacillus glycinifermentans]MEC0483499.1 hypothetical protein [Bacillus glycinifermentans]MEC0495059.1 hypothetical protein [Bacillus glycinifermentans]
MLRKQKWLALFLIVFIALAGADSALAETPSGKDKAMYVWNVRQEMNTLDNRNKLISFALQKGINLMYVMTGDYLKTDPYKYEMLNAAAAQNGIKVYALNGDKSWGQRQNEALNQMQQIYDFNQKVSAEKRFSGIQFDIEPYLNCEWKDKEARKTLIKDYLDLLAKLKTKAASEPGQIPMSAAIPFWWDGAEYDYVYQGTAKKLAYHVIDMMDGGVTMMAYRNTAAGIISISEGEADYAAKTGKPFSVAVETKDLPEAYTTFFGKTETDMNQELDIVDSRYANLSVYRGLAIHSYEYFRLMKP